MLVYTCTPLIHSLASFPLSGNARLCAVSLVALCQSATFVNCRLETRHKLKGSAAWHFTLNLSHSKVVRPLSPCVITSITGYISYFQTNTTRRNSSNSTYLNKPKTPRRDEIQPAWHRWPAWTINRKGEKVEDILDILWRLGVDSVFMGASTVPSLSDASWLTV